MTNSKTFFYAFKTKFYSLCLLVLVASLSSGCSIVVDTTADTLDTNPGDGDCSDSEGFCSVRAALQEAQSSFGRYVITIPQGDYVLDLSSEEGGGTLEITSAVQLQGSDKNQTKIIAGSTGSVITITSGSLIEINSLTVSGGDSQFGGGLWINNAEVEINDVIIEDNQGFTGGGGLLVGSNAEVDMYRCSIRNNQAVGAFGGGILNQGQLFVYDSTISQNQSNRAGGIHNSTSGILNLRNTTVSGNTGVSNGSSTGGLRQLGFAFLNNATITDNEGGRSGRSTGAGGIQITSEATTVVKNSVIADNVIRESGGVFPSDCFGSLTGDSKYNLIGNTDGCIIPSFVFTFILNADPILGPLTFNGGPTRTHLPLSGSPLTGAGYPFTPGGPAADACQGSDQRGVPRPQGEALCDIGAVEVSPFGKGVVDLMLVDTDLDIDLRILRHGDTLLTEQLPPNLSIRAVVNGTVGSVVFDYDEVMNIRTENVSPYAIDGDDAGDYSPFAFESGEHRIVATPYQAAEGEGAAGFAKAIEITVY